MHSFVQHQGPRDCLEHPGCFIGWESPKALRDNPHTTAEAVGSLRDHGPSRDMDHLQSNAESHLELFDHNDKVVQPRGGRGPAVTNVVSHNIVRKVEKNRAAARFS